MKSVKSVTSVTDVKNSNSEKEESMTSASKGVILTSSPANQKSIEQEEGKEGEEAFPGVPLHLSLSMKEGLHQEGQGNEQAALEKRAKSDGAGGDGAFPGVPVHVAPSFFDKKEEMERAKQEEEHGRWWHRKKDGEGDADNKTFEKKHAKTEGGKKDEEAFPGVNLHVAPSYADKLREGALASTKQRKGKKEGDKQKKGKEKGDKEKNVKEEGNAEKEKEKKEKKEEDTHKKGKEEGNLVKKEQKKEDKHKKGKEEGDEEKKEQEGAGKQKRGREYECDEQKNGKEGDDASKEEEEVEGSKEREEEVDLPACEGKEGKRVEFSSTVEINDISGPPAGRKLQGGVEQEAKEESSTEFDSRSDQSIPHSEESGKVVDRVSEVSASGKSEDDVEDSFADIVVFVDEEGSGLSPRATTPPLHQPPTTPPSSSPHTYPEPPLKTASPAPVSQSSASQSSASQSSTSQSSTSQSSASQSSASQSSSPPPAPPMGVRASFMSSVRNSLSYFSSESAIQSQSDVSGSAETAHDSAPLRSSSATMVSKAPGEAVLPERAAILYPKNVSTSLSTSKEGKRPVRHPTPCADNINPAISPGSPIVGRRGKGAGEARRSDERKSSEAENGDIHSDKEGDAEDNLLEFLSTPALLSNRSQRDMSAFTLDAPESEGEDKPNGNLQYIVRVRVPYCLFLSLLPVGTLTKMRTSWSLSYIKHSLISFLQKTLC